MTALATGQRLQPASIPARLVSLLASHADVIVRFTAWGAAALVNGAVVYHLVAGSRAYLGLFEDDYFYYAIVADKFVTTGRTTFDGLTLTNGFHPLWFAVVVALRSIFGRFGPAFYAALSALSFASGIVTYELSARFARELGAPKKRASLIGCVYVGQAAILLASGMESILAVPLLLYLFIEAARDVPMTVRRALKLGFVSSLAILARLDIALASLLLVVGLLFIRRCRLLERARLAAAFLLGGIAVPAYLALNYVLFGSVMPVSAVAKRLQTDVGFSVTYAERVALGTTFGPSVAIVLPVGVLCAAVLFWRRNERSVRWLSGSISLVFAFAFFGLNALTGWIFFGWYAYPILPAAVAAMVFMCELSSHRLPILLRRAAAVTVVAITIAGAWDYYLQHGPRWTEADNPLLAMSVQLQERMRDHDGVYAIGAVAGFATYLLDKPVVQLEGIIADRHLVEHIRRQSPLQTVLREYGADYLVVALASEPLQKRAGCYVITEPHSEWAGPRSARMEGALCAEPIQHFVTSRGTNPWSRFSNIETYVWDLRGADWSVPATQDSVD